MPHIVAKVEDLLDLLPRKPETQDADTLVYSAGISRPTACNVLAGKSVGATTVATVLLSLGEQFDDIFKCVKEEVE